jgi:FMN phosphatase YigB (HAD superfamily)
VSRTRAVLFDWRGTLAHAPPARWLAERALAASGRPRTDVVLDGIDAALEEAAWLPGVDASAGVHREATMRVFAAHGLDRDLALALYALDADPAPITLSTLTPRRCSAPSGSTEPRSRS